MSCLRNDSPIKSGIVYPDYDFPINFVSESKFKYSPGAKRNHNTITIYEKIGKPDIPKVYDGNYEPIVDWLFELLDSNGIRLGSICPVSDEEWYRFIKEDFLGEEIEKINEEGCKRVFVYEDFYPNDAYDIERSLKELLALIIEKQDVFFSVYIAKAFITNSGMILTTMEAENLIVEKSCFFDKIILQDLQVKDLKIIEDMALLDFHIKIEYQIKDVIDAYNEKGRLYLQRGDFASWEIFKMELPGFLI